GMRAIAEDHQRTCLDLECYPHILKLIGYCRDNGIPMAVATSSRRADIIPMLEHFGILDAFISVRGKEDVEHVKPDPELYRLAGKDLCLAPPDIYAIEVTVNGAFAAVRAGINNMVLTNEKTEYLDFDPLDY